VHIIGGHILLLICRWLSFYKIYNW